MRGHRAGGRPLLVDYFCGAGGAAEGFHRAGFDVVGVDRVRQPRYPFKFIKMDALEHMDWNLRRFDAAHASPPCQFYSSMRIMENAGEHPDMVGEVRDRLVDSGLPYSMENVVNAPLRNAVTVCGASLGLGTRRGHVLARHRLFECNFPAMAPRCSHVGKKVLTVCGDSAKDRRRAQRVGDGQYDEFEGRRLAVEAMGIDWMSWAELTQAVPPAYTELIGSYMIAHVGAAA